MTGKIKFLLDQILATRSRGDPFTEKLTRTKLLVKGIDVDLYTVNSPDDIGVLTKVKYAAKDFGVVLLDHEGNPVE